MRGAVGDFLQLDRVGERILEQTAREFDPEDAAGRAVHIAFRHLACPDCLREFAEGVLAAQIVVEAGLDREDAGLVRPRRGPMAFAEYVEAAAVAHHETVEAPFVAENLGQELAVHMVGDAVPFVV